MFLSNVEARHGKMVGLVETMVKLHRELPKAMTPHGLVRRKERIR